MPRTKGATSRRAQEESSTAREARRAAQGVSSNPIFIDAEAQARFNIYLEKSTISQRALREVDISPLGLQPVVDKFRKQSWGLMLYQHTPVYHEMVAQFYANARKGERDNSILSRVNGKDMEFNGELVNRILHITLRENTEISRFFSYGRWASNAELFDLDELKSLYSISWTKAKEAKPSALSPINHILFNMVSNLLTPTDGHRNEPNRLELYHFYCVFKEIQLDFGFIMCEYLLNTAKDTRRSMSFGKFLTPLFRYFHIPLTGKSIDTPHYGKAHFDAMNLRFDGLEWLTKAEYEIRLAEFARGPSSSIPPPSSYDPSSSHIPSHDPSSSHIPSSSSDIISYLQRIESSLGQFEARFTSIDNKIDGLSSRLERVEKMRGGYNSGGVGPSASFDDYLDPQVFDRPLGEFPEVPAAAAVPEHVSSSTDDSEETVSIAPRPVVRLGQRIIRQFYRRRSSKHH